MIKSIEFEEIRMDKLIDGERVSDGICSLVKNMHVLRALPLMNVLGALTKT